MYNEIEIKYFSQKNNSGGKKMNSMFKNIVHECDLCVVGGGLAGMLAAIAAARHGSKVVIMQDRPVFGGNASGEVRMWISGAHGVNNRETGILEEIALENIYYNPSRDYPLWDSVLFNAIAQEPNIEKLLNCSCNDCEMDGNKIVSISGWQTTTQQYHTVKAKYFADCSGDSILAPITGAEFRLGREGRDEFDESIAPEVEDKRTMGMSCLIQAKETLGVHKFTPPDWAYKYTKADLPHRIPRLHAPEENFWYMELGGMHDSIADTEELRDELLKVALGIWDFVKNSGDYNADRWELCFLGFLPGKRESRRYVGDYIMTQNDVSSEGKFDDTVAYGGWTMDDHHPGGIATRELPNIFHPAPSPFGIPYRTLYSKNIDNLFFAGRNISVTHCAMSATRVMATCGLLGQAVGTAAAIANKYGLSPRGVYEQKLGELQQTLMEDDCYLPRFKMKMSDIMTSSTITASEGDVAQLINGHDRPIGDEENSWVAPVGTPIEVKFAKEEDVKGIRFIFDSDLNRKTIGSNGFMDRKATLHNRPFDLTEVHLPETLVKNMKIELLDKDGKVCDTVKIEKNRQRLVVKEIGKKCYGVRLTPTATYGCEDVRIFSVNVF